MAYQPKSYRKFLATGVATAVVATVAAPAAMAENQFNDVEAGIWFEDHVNFGVENGIFEGYPDGDFRPYATMTRAEAVTAVLRAMNVEIPETVDASDFPDVHADNWFAPAIVTASELGVVQGMPNGDFAPNANLTRAEFSEMVFNAFELTADGENTREYSDLVEDAWYTEAIDALSSLGIVQGNPDGTFAPNADVLRNEAAAFVHRTLDPNERLVQEDPEPAELAFTSYTVLSSTEVEFTMSQDVSDAGLQASDFSVDGNRSVIDVNVDGSNVTLKFNRDLVDGATYNLTLEQDDADDITTQFTFELGAVDTISLSKNVFTAGEDVTDFLSVRDVNGVEISTADYNVVGIESSNTSIVNREGVVQDVTSGHSNLRFEIEYKDGTRHKSPLMRVDVDAAVTDELAGFELAATDRYDNTVDFENNANFQNNVDKNGIVGPKTFFYESDNAQYVQLYAYDSNENPETAALDLSEDGDYTVTTDTPNVLSVSQDSNGALIDPVSLGEGTLTVEGPNGFERTLTIEVQEDPEFVNIASMVDSLTLSDEATGTNVIDLGVNQKRVDLRWVDQYDIVRGYDLSNLHTDSDEQELIFENAVENGDKLVVSTTSSAFDLSYDGEGDFIVTANEGEEVNNANIRVSYYSEADNDNFDTQEIVQATVVDVDAEVSPSDYEAISWGAFDANYENSNTTGLTVYAHDADGNRIADVTSDVELSYSSAVRRSTQNWFELDNNTVSIVDDAWTHMTESGDLQLEYTIAGESDPHETIAFSFSNSFNAPASATVQTSPVLLDLDTAAFNNSISVEELIFGKINPSQLVMDGNESIAVRQGQDGFFNAPVVDFFNTDGESIQVGGEIYGLNPENNTGNGFVVENNQYLNDATFNVDYSITNASNLNNNNGNLTIREGDQAQFTLVVREITVNGDSRINNAGEPRPVNLLDAPQSFSVILTDGDDVTVVPDPEPTPGDNFVASGGEVIQVVPGVYNLFFADADATYGDEMTVTVDGEELVLTFEEDRGGYFLGAVQGFTQDELDNAEIVEPAPEAIELFSALNGEVIQVVPGVYNLFIPGNDFGETVTLRVEEEELELTFEEAREGYFLGAIQGFTQEELEEATVVLN